MGHVYPATMTVHLLVCLRGMHRFCVCFCCCNETFCVYFCCCSETFCVYFCCCNETFCVYFWCCNETFCVFSCCCNETFCVYFCCCNQTLLLLSYDFFWFTFVAMLRSKMQRSKRRRVSSRRSNDAAKAPRSRSQLRKHWLALGSLNATRDRIMQYKKADGTLPHKLHQMLEDIKKRSARIQDKIERKPTVADVSCLLVSLCM